MPHSPKKPLPYADFIGLLPGASWLNTWLSDGPSDDGSDVSEVLNILSNEVIQQVSPWKGNGRACDTCSERVEILVRECWVLCKECKEQGMDRNRGEFLDNSVPLTFAHVRFFLMGS